MWIEIEDFIILTNLSFSLLHQDCHQPSDANLSHDASFLSGAKERNSHEFI